MLAASFISNHRRDVRYWHLADMLLAVRDVRYWG